MTEGGSEMICEAPESERSCSASMFSLPSSGHDYH